MGKIKGFVSAVKKKFMGLWNRFRELSRKKKAVVIVVLVIAIGLVAQAIGNATKDPGYTLTTAKMGDVKEIVSESGNLSTSNRTDIYSPTNGIITAVHVENGDIVAKGQLLFEVESTATEQERRAAEANYLAAVSALNTAKANADSLQATMFNQWQTFKETAESDRYENSDGSPKYTERAESEFHIAEKSWTAAEKSYKNAETAIASAQSNVASTKLLLDATKDSQVKATADGVVENTSITEGSGVTINQVLAPVRPVMTLVGDAPVEVAIDLGESDIAKVKPGEEAVLDVSAVDDKEYKGKVVRVDSVGTDEAGVIRYAVYIEVSNPDENLKPGMSVDAEIITKQLKDVLVVPNAAVKPYKGGRAVRVPGENGEVEFIRVKIGIRGKTNTQILEGISEGQEVITALSNESIDRPSLF